MWWNNDLGHQNAEEMIIELIEHGADVCICIHCVSNRNSIENGQLIPIGNHISFQVNQSDEYGETPLHKAIYGGSSIPYFFEHSVSMKWNEINFDELYE